MDKKVYGFAIEGHSNGHHSVSPAIKEGEKVMCHDLSGFLGSWDMHRNGVFFESESGDTLCAETLKKANRHAKDKNASCFAGREKA